MNNPLPRWWMWLFYITIVFALVLPGALSRAWAATPGSSAGPARGEYEAERAQADERARRRSTRSSPRMTAEALARRPAGAWRIGERLFLNNCAQCHGSDARGSKGFPNLTDRDWLYGGDARRRSRTTITERPQRRDAADGARRSAAPRTSKNVANYVLSLSGSPHDSIARRSSARRKFAACAACHGADGKGNPALGAPNLTDKVWLHGWGEQAIVDDHQQRQAPTSMPAHGGHA